MARIDEGLGGITGPVGHFGPVDPEQEGPDTVVEERSRDFAVGAHGELRPAPYEPTGHFAPDEPEFEVSELRAPSPKRARPGKTLLRIAGALTAGGLATVVGIGALTLVKDHPANVQSLEATRKSLDAKLAANPLSNPTPLGASAMYSIVHYRESAGGDVSTEHDLDEASFSSVWGWTHKSGFEETPSAAATRQAVDIKARSLETYGGFLADQANAFLNNEAARAFGKPFYMETGMAALEQLDKALPAPAETAADKAAALQSLRAITPTAYKTPVGQPASK